MLLANNRRVDLPDVWSLFRPRRTGGIRFRPWSRRGRKLPFRLAALGLLSLPGVARESGKDLGVNDQRFLRTRHCNIEQSRFGRGVWAKPRAYEIWSETHRLPLSSFGLVSRGQDYVGARLIGFNIFDRRPEFALTVLLHQLDE